MQSPPRFWPILEVRMLYFIYEETELVAETDSLEFVQSVARRHPACFIRQSGTEKVLSPTFVKGQPAPRRGGGGS